MNTDNLIERAPRRIHEFGRFPDRLSKQSQRSCEAPMGTSFVPRGLSARAFTLRYTDSTHELNSSGRRRHPLERNKAAHVVHQIHHANLHCGTCDTDGAYEDTAHRVLLIPKHVLDASAHP